MNLVKLMRTVEDLGRVIKTTLKPESKEVLDRVVAQLKSWEDNAEKLRAEAPHSIVPWQMIIPADRPLVFSETDIRAGTVQPDVFCDMSGMINDRFQVLCQSVVIRIWSVDERLGFDERFESEQFRNALCNQANPWRRVILRFHFDAARFRSDEPTFHLQFGGTAENQEYCKIPDLLDVPRFPYSPMDLILACELVLVNFYPGFYNVLVKQDEWKRLVHSSEELFVATYHQKLSQAREPNETSLLRASHKIGSNMI